MSNADARTLLAKKLRKLHEQMRPLSLEAGIPAESYDLVINAIDEISYDSIEGELAFVQSFHDGVYTETRKYKSQKPDHWWVNLVVIFDNHDLPEQVILRSHFKEMRKEWQRRYGRSKSLFLKQKVMNGNTN